MPRPSLDPEKRLVGVAVRLEPDYLAALDMVAAALSVRAGRTVTRSTAVRAILGQVLGAVLRHDDVREAVQRTRNATLDLARLGRELAVAGIGRRGGADSNPILAAIRASHPEARELVEGVDYNFVEPPVLDGDVAGKSPRSPKRGKKRRR